MKYLFISLFCISSLSAIDLPFSKQNVICKDGPYSVELQLTYKNKTFYARIDKILSQGGKYTYLDICDYTSKLNHTFSAKVIGTEKNDYGIIENHCHELIKKESTVQVAFGPISALYLPVSFTNIEISEDLGEVHISNCSPDYDR